MLPVDNKNEEPLIHLENKAKSHENLEQTKNTQKKNNKIFSEKEDLNKLNEDTIERENKSGNKNNVREK